MDKIDYDKLEILYGYVKQLNFIPSATTISLELETAVLKVTYLYSDLMREILAKYDMDLNDVHVDNIFTDDNAPQELFGWLALPMVIPDPPDIDEWSRSQERYFRRVKSSLGL